MKTPCSVPTTQQLCCPWCNNTAKYAFSAKDRNRQLSNECFAYYRCSACGLLFLSPIPQNLEYYYPSDYYTIPVSLDELARAAQLEKYKIELVTSFAQKSQLLEIGPSYGSFAYLAQQKGFVVDTIEMDTDCCCFLRDVVGVGVIQSDDPAQALDQLGQYDVIALWHVIEHLTEPFAVLEVAAQHLKPNGILVVAAPNPNAFQMRLFGKRWTHLDAPRHLFLIPMTLLVRQMRNVGLACELYTTTDPGSLGWNTFGWQMSLRNSFRSRLVRRIMRLFGRVVSYLARPIERTAEQGSTYTLVFRKADTP